MIYFTANCDFDNIRTVVSRMDNSTKYGFVSWDGIKWYCVVEEEKDFDEITRAALNIINTIGDLSEEEFKKLDPYITGKKTSYHFCPDESILRWKFGLM
jgi:hypothetical protein